MHFEQCTFITDFTSLYYALKFRSDFSTFMLADCRFFFSFLKNCFRNFPGAKINFVPKGIQVPFEMAVKQVYKQTERQTDIFVIIIVEFKTRSLNLYMASDEL